MDSKSTINELLVSVFDNIMDLEEQVLITGEFKNISKNDMHIINAIGEHQSRSMTVLAKRLRVTVGTLTIAINNLVKKGYVIRVRSKEDKRVVLISLSEKGKCAYLKHKEFHNDMVNTITCGLDEEQTQDLILMLSTIQHFIDQFEDNEISQNL